MKIVIFGATGLVGRDLTYQALDQEHEVKAFVRRSGALNIKHNRLKEFYGDAFDSQAVTAAIEGAEAVIVSLGSSKLTGKIRSVGTRNIIQGMKHHGVKRLICQSTLGAGDSYANLNFYWKYIMFGALLRNVFKDHLQQEKLIQESNLDWTIIRPGAHISGSLTNNFKHGFGPEENNIKLKISRADVACFMLQQLKNDLNMHRAVSLSY